jgi:hypothetical protein
MEFEFEFYLDLFNANTEKKMNDQSFSVCCYLHEPKGEKPQVIVRNVRIGNFEPPTEMANWLIDFVGRDTLFEMVMAKK